jgi:hypothetical protein
LDVLPKLRDMHICAGDWRIRCRNNQWTTIQELLEYLGTLLEAYDEEAWVENSKHWMGWSANMDTAKRIRKFLPLIFRESHRKLAELISQLSYNAKEFLKAGATMQSIEDAWDIALQESNYSFMPRGKGGAAVTS